MKATILILIALLLSAATFPALKKQPAKNHIEQYIEKYLSTAQTEARIYNIPVSITLAQGIIESNCGRSSLAKKHNNHFGVKWHKGEKKNLQFIRTTLQKIGLWFIAPRGGRIGIIRSSWFLPGTDTSQNLNVLTTRDGQED